MLTNKWQELIPYSPVIISRNHVFAKNVLIQIFLAELEVFFLEIVSLLIDKI